MKNQETLNQLDTSYKYGFFTDIETDRPIKGLNEDTIKFISKKIRGQTWGVGGARVGVYR